MKKILLFTFLVPALASFGQGLISSYPFNGNANDENGTNNGTVSGATLTEDRFGNPNSAYSFDGVDDKITVQHASILNSFPLTISVWFKTTETVSNNVTIVGKYECLSYNGYSVFMDKSGIAASYYYNDFSNGASTGSLTTINDGNWHLLVTVFDVVGQKYYVDNSLVAEKSFNGTVQALTNNTNLTFGFYPQGNCASEQYTKGSIDDIKIYDKALTASEVSDLYNEGICYQSVTVTDTLVINYTITGYNPIEYANKIKVYPNPTSNLITIDSDNNSFGNTIKIINSASQEVYNGTINSNQEILDLSTWTGAGIYFLHLYDDKGNLIDIKKIVLQ